MQGIYIIIMNGEDGHISLNASSAALDYLEVCEYRYLNELAEKITTRIRTDQENDQVL